MRLYVVNYCVVSQWSMHYQLYIIYMYTTHKHTHTHAEFIHLIASEASDISENQQKKVISPEHVVEALNTLGFQEYVADVEAVHKEYKEQASVSCSRVASSRRPPDLCIEKIGERGDEATVYRVHFVHVALEVLILLIVLVQ